MTDAAAIRADIPLLAQAPMHYLDNAATSLLPREVLAAAADYDSRVRANVGRGVYRWAEEATAAYEDARRVVADALGADAAEVAFCGGATAALNMVAASVCDSLGANDSIWLAADNHHSNIIPWQIAAKRCGAVLRKLPAHESGAPDAAAAEKMLAESRETPRAIAVSHAANVCGAIADIAALSKIARARGALLIADGAQYAPHGFPNAPQSGADIYIFSGHKCYAPNGIGVLWGRREVLDSLPPSFGGGGMIAAVGESDFSHRAAPHKWEAGTPPISQAVALAAAVRWMQKRGIAAAAPRVAALAAKLREGLRALPGVRLLGAEDGMPLAAFCADGAHPHDICQLLAEDNVAARGGHHCAQPLMRFWKINGCARFSVAPYNDEDDIRAALAAVARALKILR